MNGTIYYLSRKSSHAPRTRRGACIGLHIRGSFIHRCRKPKQDCCGAVSFPWVTIPLLPSAGAVKLTAAVLLDRDLIPFVKSVVIVVKEIDNGLLGLETTITVVPVASVHSQ